MARTYPTVRTCPYLPYGPIGPNAHTCDFILLHVPYGTYVPYLRYGPVRTYRYVPCNTFFLLHVPGLTARYVHFTKLLFLG